MIEGVMDHSQEFNPKRVYPFSYQLKKYKDS